MADARARRIGIDGRELLGKPTGVGRYLAALLEVWTTDPDARDDLVIFVPDDPPAALAALGPRVTWRVLRSPRPATWWEQTTLANAAAAERLDVFFAAGYTSPLRLACPVVVAIYDVSFFAHPEWFTAREGWRRRWFTRAAARKAHRVVTISEFSATEIVRFLGIPREKIVLAPPGAPLRAHPALPGSSPPELPGSSPPELHGSSPPAPLVLFVGSLFARRRIPELLRAFVLVARQRPEARLVLVGDNRTTPRIDPSGLARDLGIGDRVEWREYESDAQLAELYSRARVFVFLSDYEGFAMTPLEALAHGVPSVLLDTPISREVYGGAARLVAPDPPAIAEGILALLDDTRERASLEAAGRQVLDRYSWRSAARTVRSALDEASRALAR